MRERAEAVGGSLDVRSNVEQGTQVIVRLPRVLDIPSDMEVRGLRVLVVDDHPLYVEGLHNLLSTRGVHVVGTAHDGLEAQDLARHSDPKLTMNVYTRLGVHDLAGALDRLPTASPERPDRDALRATGTCDAPPACNPDSSPDSWPANERNRARRNAAATDDGPIPFASATPCDAATNDNAAQPGAASCEKATHRTRTGDLSFTKAPLYQLS